ncbi:MAG: M15 family metallopeptidase [Ruminococcus sp.]|nr:M15 family metallopeptidase [Ruminococcus sp.]
MQAYGVMVGFFAFILVAAVYFMFFRNTEKPKTEPADVPQTVTRETETVKLGGSSETENSVSETTTTVRTEEVSAQPVDTNSPGEIPGHKLEVKNGITYVDGIMIVNKTYSLPSDYNPGLDPEAEAAFNSMASQAWGEGISLFICSGFRPYQEQERLYNMYVYERGEEEADRVSSRPGHSEHQSGLSMDINTTEFSFAGTPEAVWLADHCADYGFIIRFPLGKESITGYAYEPWHIRYVGVEAAKAIEEQGVCLEEYLGVTSDYRYAEDMN